MLLEERLFSSRSPDDQVHVVDVAQHVASSHPPALDLDDVHFHREEREEEEEDREVASLRDVPEGIDGAFGCCFPRRPVRVKLSSSSMEGRKLHNGRHPRKQNGSLFRAQGTHPSSSLEPLLSNQLTDQKEVDGETFLQVSPSPPFPLFILLLLLLLLFIIIIIITTTTTTTTFFLSLPPPAHLCLLPTLSPTTYFSRSLL
eukprot:762865-Hanusia_phi.AAC.2